MRDAFGGVFTMNLLLVFIFIFVAFSAVSLNYAKAFRLKNDVIDFVETNEINNLSATKMQSKEDELNKIISKDNYNKSCETLGDLLGLTNLKEGEYKKNDQLVGYCYQGVYISYSNENTQLNKIKYNITVAADWNLGALNKILVLGGEQENSRGTIAGSWTITGEAVVIKR